MKSELQEVQEKLTLLEGKITTLFHAITVLIERPNLDSEERNILLTMLGVKPGVKRDSH